MSINMDEVKKLQEELERWKIQSEKMKNEKTTLYLKKVALGDKQEELQKELDDLVLKKKRIQDDIKKQQDMFRVRQWFIFLSVK
uniref:Uncharacterized protein n=1 Tax=Pyxicephalus adspersus TaxID=30357 RepID=A0AAV2ZZ44_PYXAD|nr:TPA: hypothetical protein GDO54_015517 [Pyxicephalus adspersus]